MFSGNEKFLLVGYSFGSLLTLEIAKLLESKRKKGSVTIIDGSPQFIHTVANQMVPDNTDDKIQSVIILTCARLLFSDEFHDIAKQVFEHKTWELRLKTFVEFAQTRSHYSAAYGSKMLNALINRLKISLAADKLILPTLEHTQISLIRPADSSAKDFEQDYGLGKYSSSKVHVDVIDGNHTSILSNPDLIKLLNI